MARDIPIPNDWTEETEGWQIAMFCVPNSRKWRAVIRGQLTALAYGRLWEAETGSIKDTQQIVNRMLETLSMECGFDLDRIATAVENISTRADEYLEFIDSQYIDLGDLQGFLELAGLDKLASLVDWLGEWIEVLQLIPGIDLKINKKDLIDMAGRLFQVAGIRNDLDNIAGQMHALAISTGGPSVPTIIEALKLVIPHDDIIDLALGNLDEKLTSVGTGIIAGITGNYTTNRLDDIRNALDGGLIPATKPQNVTSAIDRLAEIAMEAGAAMESLNSAIESIANSQALLAGRPECGCAAGGTDTDSEPVGEWTPSEEYPEIEDYLNYKCRASQLVVDTWLSFWIKINAYSVDEVAGLTLGAMSGIVVGALITSGIGIPIAVIVGAVVALAGAILQQVSFEAEKLVNFLEARYDNLICILYSSSSEDEMRAAIQGEMDDYELLTTLEEGAMLTLAANNVLGRVLLPDPVVENAPDPAEPFNCQDCFDPGECAYTLHTGSGTIRFDGVPFTLSSADIGGGNHSLFFGITDDDCTAFNYCLEVVENPDLNDALTHTRTWYATDNGVVHYHTILMDSGHAPYNGNFPDGQPYPNSQFVCSNDAPFSIEFRIHGFTGASSGHPITESVACE